MKKIEQWSTETIIKKPTAEELKDYTLSKKEIHLNASPNGKHIVMETYTKGHWSLSPDIHHVYEIEELKERLK